jgi:hypothetical protein
MAPAHIIQADVLPETVISLRDAVLALAKNE